MPRVYKAAVKKLHWCFFPLIPLPVILRTWFPSWTYKSYCSSQNYSTTCSSSNTYLRAIFVGFFPCMFFYMNYYWIQESFHLLQSRLQCLAGGHLFITLRKFILPTAFLPFVPDLEKGYQSRCCGTPTPAWFILWFELGGTEVWIPLIFLLPNWRVGLSTAWLKTKTGP